MDLLDEARRAEEAVVGWLGAVWPWLTAMAAVGVVGGVLVRAEWRRRVRAALADRVRVDLVPASTFAPRREQVAWMATQVREASAAAGGHPAAARGVRVQLACYRGALAYRVEGPAWGESVLRTPAYPDVEVLDAAAEAPRVHFDGADPHAEAAPTSTASERAA